MYNVAYFSEFDPLPLSLGMTCYIDDDKCASKSGIASFSIDTCCNQWKGRAIAFSVANGTCQPCISEFDDYFIECRTKQTLSLIVWSMFMQVLVLTSRNTPYKNVE